MSKCRVRCRDCNKNFCSQCDIEPYHLGYSCEAWKEYQDAVKCRFCGDAILQQLEGLGEAFKDVCHKAECQSQIAESCVKMKECGHACKGFNGEEECLPCLNAECVKLNPELTNECDEDEYCIICYATGLGDQPSVQFGCKHMFHVECIMEKIR